jgi:hypothetical protein
MAEIGDGHLAGKSTDSLPFSAYEMTLLFGFFAG